jgi:predicted Zn-dependent protease
MNAPATLLAALALTAHATTVDELVRQADTADEHFDNQRALTLYLEADSLRPGNSEILRKISKQYDQLTHSARGTAEKRRLATNALAAAEAAVAADPRNPKAHLALAVVSGRLAQMESAPKRIALSKQVKESAERAAALNPSEDYAWHILGRWNYEIANLNPVLKALAETVYGRFPDATNEKAIACFEKAIAVGPPRVLHHIELARSLAAAGRPNEAQAQLKKGLALPPLGKDDEHAQSRGREMLKKL